ncbi:MAG: helix-hairpin-helix domain-containing protein [Balneolales bacterium]
MIKRTVYFWIDHLQISPGERLVMIILFSALLIISAVRIFWQPALAFDDGFYDPIEAEFNRLSAIRSEEESALLARYYPDIDKGTKKLEEAFHTERQVSVEAEADTSANPTEPDLININTADTGGLTKLPGIGTVIAQRIIVYREEHGAFETLDELSKVRGIGPVKLDQIKKFLKVQL